MYSLEPVGAQDGEPDDTVVYDALKYLHKSKKEEPPACTMYLSLPLGPRMFHDQAMIALSRRLGYPSQLTT